MNNEQKNDGWPTEFTVGPVIDRVAKVGDFIINLFNKPDRNPPKQFVPFEENEPWMPTNETKKF